jgi:beta-glucanase (GH16 family)
MLVFCHLRSRSSFLKFLLLAVNIFFSLVYAAPPSSAKWEPVREIWDDFNGDSLDQSRWGTHSRHYLGKKPGLYLPRNVTVGDGMLKLWARAETIPASPTGYHSFTTAFVSSRKPVLYGYFEVRAKPMMAAIDCAFWFYRWTETGTYEIDVFEIGGTVPKREKIVHTNAHVFVGNPELENDDNRISDPQSWLVKENLADDFHTYGLEWDVNELRYYFDGVLIRRKQNTSWHVPMLVRFAAETQPNWFGLPKEGELPAVFLIDYFHAWRKISDDRQLTSGLRQE